ncbi:MAG: hypothetical protein HQK89_10535 [Nitrospirae bacterium]|nr:hypothetical protein [Nitrospirota bacterium]
MPQLSPCSVIIDSSAIPTKSVGLCVTNGQLYAIAVAAIHASSTEIGCFFLSELILAHIVQVWNEYGITKYFFYGIFLRFAGYTNILPKVLVNSLF